MSHGNAAREKHPLVEAYLADLDRALSGADPREREDAIAGVREHIESLLAEGQHDSTTVEAVLGQLGPVEQIASEATPAMHDTSGWPSTTGAILLGLSVLSALLALLIPFAAVPLALGVGITAVMGARRANADKGLYWAALSLSAAALVVVALGAFFALRADREGPVPAGDGTVTRVPNPQER